MSLHSQIATETQTYSKSHQAAKQATSPNSKSTQAADKVASGIVKVLAPIGNLVYALSQPSVKFFTIATLAAIVGFYTLLINIESYANALNFQPASFVPKAYVNDGASFGTLLFALTQFQLYAIALIPLLIQFTQTAYWSRLYDSTMTKAQSDRVKFVVFTLIGIDIAASYNQYPFYSDGNLSYTLFFYFIASVMFADLLFAYSVVNWHLFVKSLK